MTSLINAVARLAQAEAALHVDKGILVEVTDKHLHAYLHFKADPIENAILSVLTKIGQSHTKVSYEYLKGCLVWIVLTDANQTQVYCAPPYEVIDFFQTRYSLQSWEFKPFHFILET